MTALAINPGAALAWLRIDDFGTQALVVDDALVDPSALRTIALGLAFQPPSVPDRYPGLKSYVALPGTAGIKQWIADRVLARRFPDERPPMFRTDDYDEYGAFSVFACDLDRPPADLEDQHTDDVAWLAGVLHLSTEIEGRGTGLWEHRPTGLQQWIPVDPVRLTALERTFGLRLSPQIERAMQRHPQLTSAADVPQILRKRPEAPRRWFSRQEDPFWRLVEYIPARWNRLVVYPTWQIHSVVDESTIVAPTIDNARLTYNVMIDFPFARERTRSRSPYPRAFYRSIPGLQ